MVCLPSTDLCIPQGVTWQKQWQVTWQGAPIDATWTARSQVRRRAADTDVLYEFAATVDGQGVVTIAVDPAVSSAWTWTYGVYDVEVQAADGTVARIAQGSITVDREVTRG